MNLENVYVPIGELKPYEGNAKKHDPKQIEQIKKSIQTFGMNDPIAVWGENVIVEGHGRLIACNELGVESVPIIRLDHLDDEQRRAYCLAHNKLTMNTGFDIEALNDELSGILDIDMSDFGFELDFGDIEDVGNFSESDFNYQNQYGVTVICDNESEQEKIYNELTGKGYTCKVVTV